MERRASLRPHSTTGPGSNGIVPTWKGLGRTITTLRKVTSAFTPGSESSSGRSLSSGPRKVSLIDSGQLEGKIKVSSAINNSDLCLSVNYRADGRYYSVALAGGVINVYSSKTDNIVYGLNNTDKNLPFTNVAATCVRFRPSHLQKLQEQYPSSLKGEGRREGRRKSSLSVGSNESSHFLPPIAPQPMMSSLQHHPFSQRRRKSSASALGVRPEELSSFPSASEKTPSNNLVTASFTDGSLKTFNFITEQCVKEIKENREILTIGYNSTGKLLATGGGDGAIHVYDDETNAKICSYVPPFEYKAELLRTYSIAFHPELECEFISGGWNKYIQFYDTRVPNLIVGKVAGPKICGEGLSFHTAGLEFCAAAKGKQEGVQIFDYSMRRPLESILDCFDKSGSLPDSSKHSTPISRKSQSLPPTCLYSASYFMDNFIVASGAYPGGLTVVDRNSGRNVIAGVHELKESVYCIDTFQSKIVFIVGEEVCVIEVYL